MLLLHPHFFLYFAHRHLTKGSRKGSFQEEKKGGVTMILLGSPKLFFCIPFDLHGPFGIVR